MSNLHPDAPTEGNATNPYNSGHNMMLGRPIELLVQRLDAVVLVLKTCIGDQCRWPWKQLHPNGQVNTLTDALDPQYDSFYAHTYKVAQVGWEECYWGYNHKSNSDGGPMDSTCYNASSSHSQFQPNYNANPMLRLKTSSPPGSKPQFLKGF